MNNNTVKKYLYLSERADGGILFITAKKQQVITFKPCTVTNVLSLLIP